MEHVEKLGKAPAAIVGDTPEDRKLAAAFIESQDVKEISRRVYAGALRKFLDWLDARAITSPDRETVLAYKRTLEKDYSPFSVSAYLTPVRLFFSYLETLKVYPNVAGGIKSAKKPNGNMRDPLTLDQVKILLNSIDRETLRGKRDYALINLLVNTGLRTVEVIRANVEDIRQESGETLLWIQGKGRDAKDEPALLEPEVSGPLFEYLGQRGNGNTAAPLFTSLSNKNTGGRLTTRSISRIVKTRLQAIGINSKRITAHSMRNTAIMNYIKASAGDLIGAQTLARHADPRTTQRYIKRVNRIENAPERKISKAYKQAGVYA